MTRYLVTITRTEEITFEVETDSVESAEANYWAEGEETSADTTNLTVLSVEELTS